MNQSLFSVELKENEIVKDNDLFLEIVHDIINNEFFYYGYCHDKIKDVFDFGVNV